MSTTIASEDLGTGFCRVAIAAPTTRVDLALPVGVPVVSLLPAIVTRAEQDPTASHGWTLRRLDGARLDPAAPLALAGVREGARLTAAGIDEDRAVDLARTIIALLEGAFILARASKPPTPCTPPAEPR